ncbi:MAG: T9SS type A sorting domain-containing protein [Saprospiraceae bacterium]|nr:T9SS type A sorting domain-containing protein [Saprospiraceae bacterium]
MVNQSFHSKLKLSIAFILLIGIVFGMQAQKHFDYNWLFGYGTGIPDSTNPFGGVIMSFQNGRISFIPQARLFEFNYQSNSFSKNTGELLYMSNGCSIADKDADILNGGDSISYGKVWPVACPKYLPSVQAGTFINFLNDSDQIIFLHTIIDTIGIEPKVNRKAILESKIDLRTNSVLSKNKIILYSRLIGHGFTSIPNKDYLSWWLIAPQKDVNRFWILLYTKNGIEKALDQQIGVKNDSISNGGGQGVFSPDGKKYAIYTRSNGLQVFDFDRSTGVLSNFHHYFLTYSQNVISGCSFSPNSRFVYISNPTEVLQVDLLEQNPSLSIDTVGVFDNFFDPYPTTYLQMALAPDCRIYISTYGGNRYLHVIMEPNKKGKECNLVNRGLKLPTRNSFAIPNFPHYRVDDPYPCDSTISFPLNTAVDNEYKFKDLDIIIYPNPVSTVLFIHDLKGKINSQFSLRLTDLNGKVLLTQQYNLIQEEIKIPIQGLQPGMFIIQIIDQKGNYWTDKFIKE